MASTRTTAQSRWPRRRERCSPPNYGDYTITTSPKHFPYASPTTSISGATVTLTGVCFTVNSGDVVQVVANNTANPSTTSTSDVVNVTTSSNTTAASTPTYSIVAAKSVSSPSVSLLSNAPGAGGVTYDVGFTRQPVARSISSDNISSGNHGDFLAAPAGTVFSSNYADYSLDDVTQGRHAA